jgi:hypothetical protein
VYIRADSSSRCLLEDTADEETDPVYFTTSPNIGRTCRSNQDDVRAIIVVKSEARQFTQWLPKHEQRAHKKEKETEVSAQQSAVLISSGQSLPFRSPRRNSANRPPTESPPRSSRDHNCNGRSQEVRGRTFPVFSLQAHLIGLYRCATFCLVKTAGPWLLEFMRRWLCHAHR